MSQDEDNPNREIFDEFIIESREALERVEPLLIELERGAEAPNGETLAVIFRCFHSFKGTASFIGLDVTARLAHSAESLLDWYRCGAPIQHAHVDTLCATLDAFRKILDLVEAEYSDQAAAQLCQPIAHRLDEYVDAIKRERDPRSSKHSADAERGVNTSKSGRSEVAAGEGASSALHEAGAGLEDITQLLTPELVGKFIAESEEHLALVEEVLVAIEAGLATTEQVADAFRAMHSFKGNCGICGCAELEQLAHHVETLLSLARTEGGIADERRISLLLEAVDALRVGLHGVPTGNQKVPKLKHLLQRLIDACADGTRAANLASAQKTEQLANGAAGLSLDAENEHDAAAPAKAADGAQAGVRGATSIRVDTEKLDELMNLVGELIIAETTVTKNPDLEGHEFENFQKAALNLNRLTRALQDIAMAVRMVPIANTFRKMIRLIRDVSSKQSKRVELITNGEDTEVDKTVVETIADPLVHLIRNAVDHGIEPTEERVKNGKPPVGHVWLSARHQGGEVWITLRDDGRGLDPEKILKKAVEKKLADPARRYTDREIMDMIYAPGFSTAAVVTDISGRGVGMDVVRRNIEAISGRIETTSELGVGTTFTLRIPLTLAIIEGMLVRVGSSYYTIPLLTIRESVRAKRKDITATSDGCELLKLRRRHYPIVRIHALHSIPGAQEVVEEGILVVVEAGDNLVCLLVDEVIGQCQTVIKALPEYLRRVRGLSGCSILHNGDISLILDVESVVDAAKTRAA